MNKDAEDKFRTKIHETYSKYSREGSSLNEMIVELINEGLNLSGIDLSFNHKMNIQERADVIKNSGCDMNAIIEACQRCREIIAMELKSMGTVH